MVSPRYYLIISELHNKPYFKLSLLWRTGSHLSLLTAWIRVMHLCVQHVASYNEILQIPFEIICSYLHFLKPMWFVFFVLLIHFAWRLSILLVSWISCLHWSKYQHIVLDILFYLLIFIDKRNCTSGGFKVEIKVGEAAFLLSQRLLWVLTWSWHLLRPYLWCDDCFRTEGFVLCLFLFTFVVTDVFSSDLCFCKIYYTFFFLTYLKADTWRFFLFSTIVVRV